MTGSAHLPQRASRGRIWLKRLALAVAVLISPLIALVIYNQIDEAPSALATKYSQLPPMPPDEQNAWLALVGIGAGEQQATLDWARQWSEAVRSGEPAPVSPTPHQAPSADKHGIRELCPFRAMDCLGWAAWAGAGLDRLTADNALRLQRYTQLLPLRGWRDLSGSRLDAPTTDGYQTAVLFLDWQARALERAVQANDAPAIAAALDQIHRHALFWASAGRQADSLTPALTAAIHIHRSHRLVDGLVDRLRGDRLRAAAEEMARILAIEPTRFDWEGAMAGEHRLFVDAVRAETGWSALTTGDFEQAFMGLFFAPQATWNLHAQLTDLNVRFLQSTPDVREAAQQALAQYSEALMPPLGDAAKIPGYFSYNAVGQILTAVSVPAYASYGDRVWDIEAMRRAMIVKLQAALQQIEPAAMAAFVGNAGTLDPWTHAPFAWDELREEMYLAPRSDYWQRERLAVRYRQEMPSGVRLCSQQWGVTLTIGAEAPMIFRSCGDHFDAMRTAADGDELAADDSPTPGAVALRGKGEAVWVELRRNHDGAWRLYGAEVRLGEQAALAPIGHDQPIDATVSALPLRHDRWLTVVQPTDVMLSALVLDAARALNVPVAGIERLADTPISMHWEGPSHETLAMLADVGEAELSEPPTSRIAFRRRP